jgi:hypothetical protein
LAVGLVVYAVALLLIGGKERLGKVLSKDRNGKDGEDGVRQG